MNHRSRHHKSTDITKLAQEKIKSRCKRPTFKWNQFSTQIIAYQVTIQEKQRSKKCVDADQGIFLLKGGSKKFFLGADMENIPEVVKN